VSPAALTPPLPVQARSPATLVAVMVLPVAALAVKRTEPPTLTAPHEPMFHADAWPLPLTVRLSWMTELQMTFAPELSGSLAALASARETLPPTFDPVIRSPVA
jgi:hypothetical protein